MCFNKVFVIIIDVRTVGFNLFYLFIFFTTGSPFWAMVIFGYGMQPNLMLVSTPVWQETNSAWQAVQELSQSKVFPLCIPLLILFWFSQRGT